MSIKWLKELSGASSQELYDAASKEAEYITEDQHRRGVNVDIIIVSRLIAAAVTLVADAEDDRAVLDDNIKCAVEFIRANAKKAFAMVQQAEQPSNRRN